MTVSDNARDTGPAGSSSIHATVGRHRRREDALFEQYIAILEAQYTAIDRRETDRIADTLRLERQVLADLEALASIALPGMAPHQRPSEGKLLLARAKKLHARNRELLAKRSAEMAEQIRKLKIPPQRRSVYNGRNEGGAMVDLKL